MPKDSPYNPDTNVPAPFREGAYLDIMHHYTELEDWLEEVYPSRLAPLALTLGLWRRHIEANYCPPASLLNDGDRQQVDTQAKASMLCHLIRGYKTPANLVDISQLAGLAPVVQLAYLLGYDLKTYIMPQRLILAFDRTYSHNVDRINALSHPQKN